MTYALVLDTSYLLELYEVPTFSRPEVAAEVKRRVRGAVVDGAELVVPLGVAFEVGNHIADVKDAAARSRLAREWSDNLCLALTRGPDRPFLVVPTVGIEDLCGFGRRWATELAKPQRQRKPKGDIGLTDWSTVEVASALGRRDGWIVHIWTKDRALKRREPHEDPDPYLG